MAKMSIDEAPRWVKSLENDLHRAALRGVQSAGQRLVARVHEVIDGEPRKPVDRGIYRGAWRSRNEPNGCSVENSSPQAVLIEEGVRAGNVKVGRAMIDALVGWVQRHGMVRDVDKSERGSAARSIAFAIATSMKRRGIFAGGGGLHVLEKARRSVTRFIDEEVRAEIRKARL